MLSEEIALINNHYCYVAVDQNVPKVRRLTVCCSNNNNNGYLFFIFLSAISPESS